MIGLAARLRGFDGVVLALALVVGHVYVQALRAFVGGLVMPLSRGTWTQPMLQ